jgi:hypothetical protein
MFAIFLGFAKKCPRLGLLTAALAIFYFLGVATPVMHSAVAGSGEPLIRHVHRYHHLLPEGTDAPSSVVQMGLIILSSPGGAIRHLFDSPQFAALIQVLIPVGIIALLYPPAWIAVTPVTLAHLLSSWPAQSRLEMYHALGILPWIFLASLYSLEPLRRGLCERRAVGCICEWLIRFLRPLGLKRSLAAGMVVTSLLLYPHIGAFPGGGRFQGWPSPPPYASDLAEILPMVPADARVAATANLVPRLSQRPRIHMLPDFPEDVEYVVIGLRGRTNPVSPRSLQQLVDHLRRHPNWVTVRTSPQTGNHLFRLRSEVQSELLPSRPFPAPFIRNSHSVEKDQTSD